MILSTKGWRVACAGVAEGRARIIRSQSDLVEFERSDILIAAQTDMNYTPQMLIAAAVITEEGGRYSHASIFCRENGITCIVGVAGALDLIKDRTHIRIDTSVPEIVEAG